MRHGDGEDDRRCFWMWREGLAGSSPKLDRGAKLGEQDLVQWANLILSLSEILDRPLIEGEQPA